MEINFELPMSNDTTSQDLETRFLYLSVSPAPSSSSALSDYSTLDRFGFISPSTVSLQDSKKVAKKENERSVKWVKMMKKLQEEKDLSQWPKIEKKFTKRLTKGIPDCLRSSVWKSFLEPLEKGIDYEKLIENVCGFERQIDLDIERTLRDHMLFIERFGDGQTNLFKNLVAICNFQPDVGYCQGMSSVSAFLLMYFDEKEAFLALISMFQKFSLQKLFGTGFEKLFETFYIQEILMKEYIPKIYDKLNDLTISLNIYSPKLYLTLFQCLPHDFALRVWDVFLFYGFDILICCSIALLKCLERDLLSKDYEHIMTALSNFDSLPFSPNDFMKVVERCWKISKKKFDFDLFRKEYNSKLQTN